MYSINNIERNKMKKLPKKLRKEWWRSLTLDEQVEWRMNLEEEQGRVPDYNKIYSQTLAENNYMK